MAPLTPFRFALILSLLAGLPGCSKEEPSAFEGLAAQDASQRWTGQSLFDGSTVEFPAVLADQPAVMIFWATWCPYCKAFMPYAREIQQEYAARGVQIVTLNAKERGRGDPLAYMQSLNFPTVSIADADPIAELYGIEYIPGLMVVDGDGRQVYERGWTELPAGRKVAEQWASEVRGALDRALGIPVAP